MKLALVNMPFADARYPSIALTQLRSVLDEKYGQRVSSQIFYLNHDYACLLGPQLYEAIANNLNYLVPGLGDLLFMKAAFPDRDDQTESQVRKSGSDYRMHRQEVDTAIGKRAELHALLDELIDRYELDRFDVVGFTSMFVQNVASIAMARRLKERNPDIVTVMGGANCETPMGQVLAKNVEVLDFVFSGPGLKNFPAFIGHLLEGSIEACHNLTGVFSAERMRRDDKALEIKEIGPELPIDEDVPLDYDCFLQSIVDKGMSDEGVGIFFETSRGCWWGERAHCTFCGLNGMTMKYRSMESARALELIRGLIDRYYPRVRHFQCVDNIMPREYLTEVFPKLEVPDDFSIFYEVKADLKPNEMQTLAMAGVTVLQPGIEALSTPVLKLMRKGTTALQNVKFLKGCLSYGITPTWNLLIGFPREEEEVYEKYLEDLPSLVHLPPPNGVGSVRFDRFSPYFDMADEYNLRLKPYDFYKAIYPFSRKDLAQMAYYFVDVSPGSYKRLRAKWRPKLEEPLSRWKSLWEEGSQEPRPELKFGTNGDSHIVYDTRAEDSLQHEVGEVGARILKAAEKAIRPARIAKSTGLDESEVEDYLASFLDKRLVMRDESLFISLVVSYPESN